MKKLVRCWVPDEVISDALGLEKLLFIMKQIGNNLYIYTSFYDHFLTFFFTYNAFRSLLSWALWKAGSQRGEVCFHVSGCEGGGLKCGNSTFGVRWLEKSATAQHLFSLE